MSEPIWNRFLTERDKAVFAASGYGARGGFGRRPALLIIDVNWAFCGDKPEPILESIKRWRNSCGEDAWAALPYIKSLIDKCRQKGIPVIYTTGMRREDNWDGGSWLWKNARGTEDQRLRSSNLDGNEIVTPIAPGPRDIVVYKQKPSGFFGSNLAMVYGSETATRNNKVGKPEPRCLTWTDTWLKRDGHWQIIAVPAGTSGAGGNTLPGQVIEVTQLRLLEAPVIDG